MSLNEPTPQHEPLHPRRGRRWLLLGILTAFAGPLIYYFQFSNKILISPWYVPVLATLGAVLAVLSATQRRSLWRMGSAGLLGVFAAFVWLMFLVALAAPPYSGSVEVGRAFPNFQTRLAAGAEFGQDALRGDQNTVLLFFRGRW